MASCMYMEAGDLDPGLILRVESFGGGGGGGGFGFCGLWGFCGLGDVRFRD